MNAKKTNYWQDSNQDGFGHWIESHGYSAKTAQTYGSMIFAYFDYIESKGINIELSNKTITDHFFKTRQIGNKTKNTYLWLISDIMDDMIDCGHISINNVAAVLDKKRTGMRGKTAKRLPTVLSAKETDLLMAYIEKLPKQYGYQRERCALLLLLGTGLRAQELCDLKTSDMHLNDESPYINVIGKFDKERVIPLPESIIGALLDFKEMKADKARASVHFLSALASGNGYVTSSVYRMVNTALIDAGIVKSKLSPHVLRHTFITRQLTQGVSLVQVKNWAGHESIATTAIYEHVATAIHGARTVI